MEKISWKHILMVIVSVAAAIGICLGIAFFVVMRRQPEGRDLNQKAWEASYIERGSPVPMRGPREGYWGSRITPKMAHELLGWRENKVYVPGLLDIDGDGIQRYISHAERPLTILIIGDSVAFGSYASTIDTVYFQVLGKKLDAMGLGSNIFVYASGGWRSPEELTALRIFASSSTPDLVIFLNGLNDLTIGHSATSSLANLMAAKGGLTIEPQFHAQDYDKRTAQYLDNMAHVVALVKTWKGQVLFVLQPALFTQINPTAIEKKLLADSVESLRLSLPPLESKYEEFRKGLSALAVDSHVHFFDASRLFAGESYTTFTDLWHFSDYGHTVLGLAIAEKLAPILRVVAR